MRSKKETTLKGCNHTELMALCRKAGRAFHPAMSREQLLQVLQGFEVCTTPHPIDNLRDGILAFLYERRETLASQLTCPAKAVPFDHRACYQCTDLTPIRCTLVQPPSVLHQIQLKRKPCPYPPPC